MSKYTPEQQENVFWARVDLSHAEEEFSCWEWRGGVSSKRYGQSRLKGEKCYSHRVAYQLAFGEISKNLLVCHHCDNPKCCNPNHLFLGTSEDNQLDMYQKGRGRKASGNNSGKRKLTSAQVSEIRAKYDSAQFKGGLQSSLSRDYHVSTTTIRSIVLRITWEENHD